MTFFIGRFVEDQGGNGQQGIEPASGLITASGDEVGGELPLEQFLVFKGIMMLGEGHGAGIEPAVNDLRHPLHGAAAFGQGKVTASI